MFQESADATNIRQSFCFPLSNQLKTTDAPDLLLYETVLYKHTFVLGRIRFSNLIRQSQLSVPFPNTLWIVECLCFVAWTASVRHSQPNPLFACNPCLHSRSNWLKWWYTAKALYFCWTYWKHMTNRRSQSCVLFKASSSTEVMPEPNDSYDWMRYSKHLVLLDTVQTDWIHDDTIIKLDQLN